MEDKNLITNDILEEAKKEVKFSKLAKKCK